MTVFWMNNFIFFDRNAHWDTLQLVRKIVEPLFNPVNLTNKVYMLENKIELYFTM